MIKKVFRQMLLTQVISSMTVMICMVIDSIMIGRFLGVDAMSAYGLATPVLLIFAAFGSMLAAGIQVYCGKTMARGDTEGTNACYSNSIVLAAAVAVAGLALVLIFTGPIITLLGAGKPGPANPVYDLTRDYVRGFIVGAPAFILAQIMVPYMQIAGKRSLLVAAVIAMTVSDVAFDILNVFVFHGGTLGMGLASSLSYYIALLVAGGFFLKKGCMFRFRLKLAKWKRCLELMGYGIPTVVNQISQVLLVFILNKLLLREGSTLAVAAFSVISTIGNLCYCFAAGVGSVALLLASILYSDEDRPALYELVRTMNRWAVVLSLAVTAAVLLAAPLLVSLFLTDNPAARDMAILGTRLFAVSLLPSSLNSCFKNYYHGIRRTRFSEVISALQNFVMIAASALLLSIPFSTTGIWLGYLCGECLTLLALSAVVWKQSGKLSLSAPAYALLPEGFGAREGDYLELSFRDIPGALAASQKVYSFCQLHGESPRDCMMIGLCVEEIGVNVIEHGFAGSGRQHSAELRLLIKDGKRVIRLRDDCVSFDPVHYMDLHRDDDPTAHIGLRMVMKMVRRANYINTLGLNNLTLEL
ncbi:MAG: ATP-binding protein [Oscillospiraceae bacterium]|nr:ATP-binding protein [Oscillospiraceae bacterium]